MPLIWKCQLKAHITFLTASTGGIFSLSDTRWALCLKKFLQTERGWGGGPWAFAVPKSLILTCLISIHRHRLSSVIRLNKESTFASRPKPIVCFHRPKRNLLKARYRQQGVQFFFLACWERTAFRWKMNRVGRSIYVYECSLNAPIHIFKGRIQTLIHWCLIKWALATKCSMLCLLEATAYNIVLVMYS